MPGFGRETSVVSLGFESAILRCGTLTGVGVCGLGCISSGFGKKIGGWMINQTTTPASRRSTGRLRLRRARRDPPRGLPVMPGASERSPSYRVSLFSDGVRAGFDPGPWPRLASIYRLASREILVIQHPSRSDFFVRRFGRRLCDQSRPRCRGVDLPCRPDTADDGTLGPASFAGGPVACKMNAPLRFGPFLVHPSLPDPRPAK